MDTLLNNCIIGLNESGWSWLCRKCGDGELIPEGTYDNLTFKRDYHTYDKAHSRALLHQCPA